MVFNYVLIFIISYLLGCVPFSLLVTKYLTGKNPGKLGSGNYGAMNSYEITNKKYIFVVVFLFDALKGAFAVIIVCNLIFPKSNYVTLSTISVVLGHCFNVFLRFKGGRGLSTALGSICTFNPLLAVVWCILWFLFWRIIKKNIIFANMWATLIAPAIIYGVPGYWFFNSYYLFYVTIADYKIMAIILCSLIFIAHLRKNS